MNIPEKYTKQAEPISAATDAELFSLFKKYNAKRLLFGKMDKATNIDLQDDLLTAWHNLSIENDEHRAIVKVCAELIRQRLRSKPDATSLVEAKETK